MKDNVENIYTDVRVLVVKPIYTIHNFNGSGFALKQQNCYLWIDFLNCYLTYYIHQMCFAVS